MSTKSSNALGMAAIIAAVFCVLFLFRKRLRPGFLIFSLVIAVIEKWREQRDLEQVRTLVESDIG